MGAGVVILGRGKARWGYDPPIEVKRHRGPLSDDQDQRIEQLLWIPASLVSRLCGQYPRLRSEADELFSVGVQAIVETVREDRHPAEKIGRVCHGKARRAMENYANGVDTVIKVSNSTRWKRFREGQPIPKSQGEPQPTATYDDLTDVVIRDACQPLGYTDLSKLNARQKRRLKESVL